jgi:hypothetical protein
MINLKFSNFPESSLFNVGKKTTPYLADKTRFFHPDEISVNEKFGTITDRFVGETNEALIIHIQEAHFNQDSYVSVINIIDELIHKTGITLLLKESDSGEDSRNYFERYCYSDKQKIKEIQDDIDDNTYSADKYLYIFSDYPLDCRGVDNQKLRDSNYLCFANFDPLRPAARRYLGEIQQQIEDLKQHIYCKALLEFELMKQKCRDSSIALNAWAQFLKKKCGKKRSKDLETRFPNFFHFLNTIDMEERIVFFDVDGEREHVLSTLNKTLNPQMKQILFDMRQNFIKGHIPPVEFYSYILSQCDNPEKNTKNLFLYTQYLTEFSLINTISLFEEIDDFAQGVYQQLITNKEQQMLKEISERVDLLLEFLDLALGPKAYQFYMSQRETFDIDAWLPFLNESLMEIGSKEVIRPPAGYQKEVFSKLQEFYDTCIRRAYHFVDRTLMHIEHSRSNAGILITGGFHSFTIKRLLKQKKISYVVISPRINSDSDDAAKDKSFRQAAKRLLE